MPYFLRTLLAACGIATSAAWAQTVEAVSIPFQASTEQPARMLRLHAFVYKPLGAGPHPVVIFSHGSAAGNPKANIRASVQAEYFAQRGFIVVVPMRRGRGASTGVSLESEEKNCDVRSWEPGLRAAFEDLSAVFGYVDTLAGADASRVVLAGASRGGFLSVAYAASGERRATVVGVINFVGGWVAQAEDDCPTDFNHASFTDFGARTKVPMLWLYGENDPFYSGESIRSYAEAFKSGGGDIRFDLVKGVPGNGHALPGHPSLWGAAVDSYLASLGFRLAGP